MDLDNLLPLYAGCEGGSQRDLAPAQLNNETASVPVDDTALVAITAHADTEADDEVTDLAQEPPLSRQDGLTEPYTAYKALELRKEVYRRGLRPTKKGPQANCTKAGYMKLLRNFDRTYQLYDQIAVGSGGQKRKASPDQTIKTKHFSHKNAWNMAGRLPKTAQVDSLKPRIDPATPERRPPTLANGSATKRRDEELALLREMVGLVRGGNNGADHAGKVDRDGLLRQLKTTIETMGLLQVQLRGTDDADQIDDLQVDLEFFADIKNKIKEKLRC
ncbi:hypothetical protein GN958_ATG18181 [Phytophthora infestans]|uniref:Uncharacterized protein n=1 Tax=Phytophthora infestans TaxID=4787 RepID=A0A8S9TLA7_PHYIN|nr:hypothetical protein GN958_ATG23483 [Phytophthora infestans]KAF4132652.1 hypothetical protein GN958_ATG18181 [Phytophthora infestans]